MMGELFAKEAEDLEEAQSGGRRGGGRSISNTAGSKLRSQVFISLLLLWIITVDIGDKIK